MQGIYRIDKDGKCLYVGQSCDIEKRRKHHKWMLENGKHTNQHLQHIWDNDCSGFSFSVVEEVESHDDITVCEQKWIDVLRPRCNMQLASDNGMWNPSQEVRNKISNALTGKKHNMTDAGRERIRLTYLGKSLPNETKKKISESKRGIRMDDSARNVKHKIPDREWLKSELARVGGGSNLARELGCNKLVVKRWCEMLDVPFYAADWGKKTYERPTLNKLVSALIYRGYHGAAETFGCSPNVVKRWCAEYNIPYKKSDWMEIQCLPVKTC